MTNPNTFAVQITAVTGNGSITSDAGAACTAGHGVTLADQAGLSLSLAAGATTVFSLAGAASMSTSSVNSCQGAVFFHPGNGHRRKRLAVAMLALLLAPAAAGAWGMTGSGGGAGGAASMPAGAAPTAVAVLTSVAVSWSAATVGGTPVAGYRVRRYATVGGAESAVAGTCAGVVAATGCTDSGVSLGSWRYTVTPVQHAWLGGESAQGLPVVVP